MKLLLTGGHPAPMLAVVDQIRSDPKYKDIEIVVVGRQFNNSNEDSVSYEYEEITRRGIAFIDLPAGRVTRTLDWQSFINILRLPGGFIAASRIVEKVVPDAVLTFGGYLGLPIAQAANKHKIPVYLHEQTIAPGKASEIMGKFSKKIFLSYPDDLNSFQDTKEILTGNILRADVFTTTVPKWFHDNSKKPLLYITGGSLGSHSLNVMVEKNLTNLLKTFQIIHQTGNVKEFNDYDRLLQVKENLAADISCDYYVRPHITTKEVGFCMQKASVIASRSGANTTTELIALKKPAVLVPLPWSARHEQQKHAELLAKNGCAVVVLQTAPVEEFYKAILDVFKNAPAHSNAYTKLASLYNPHAADKILETIIQA